MEMDMRGKLITFEGSEGSGKSTQIRMIGQHLKKKGKKFIFIREPGSNKISERIRKLLLDVKNAQMSKECETLLYMAARAQLVDEVIMPALKKGDVVLCDRFLDSTVVYQGYGCGVDITFIKKVGRFATQGVSPDLTFFFDIDAKKGLSRINRRKKDRIERRNIHYHNKVRNGYKQIARREPKRIKLIKSSQSKEEIHKVVRTFVDKLLNLK